MTKPASPSVWATVADCSAAPEAEADATASQDGDAPAAEETPEAADAAPVDAAPEAETQEPAETSIFARLVAAACCQNITTLETYGMGIGLFEAMNEDALFPHGEIVPRIGHVQ